MCATIIVQHFVLQTSLVNPYPARVGTIIYVDTPDTLVPTPHLERSTSTYWSAIVLLHVSAIEILPENNLHNDSVHDILK